MLSRRFEIVRMRYYGALSIPLVLVFSKLLRREYPRKAGREGSIGRIYGALCDFEVGHVSDGNLRNGRRGREMNALFAKLMHSRTALAQFVR